MRPPWSSGRLLSWGAIALVLVMGCGLLAVGVDLRRVLVHALERIEALGLWGPVVFVLVYVVACLLLVPGSVLTLGAGLLFGWVGGTLCVSAASTLGATAAFIVARHLARDRVARMIAGHPRFEAIDQAVGHAGAKVVLLLRLSPVFPFNVLNYALGLTRVRLGAYVLASWVGMMPGTVFYVYLGSLVGDLATLGTGGRHRTMAEWGVAGFGVLMAGVVALYVARLARRAWNELSCAARPNESR